MQTSFGAAHSLLRLNLRIDGQLSRINPLDQHLVRVKHFQPVSPWIDTVNPDNALSGVQVRAIEVAGRLLALARGHDPVDPHYAALEMQSVSPSALQFSTRVRRFAARYGVTLTERVRDELGAIDAAHDVMRAVDRIAAG